MRSNIVVAGETGFVGQYTNLRHDARGASFLLPHQQLGALTLPTEPSDGDTVTLDINGNNIVLTAKTTLGTTPGEVLIGGSAAVFAANVLALLNQPQTTTSTGVALSTADQQLVSYLSWSLVGTTITASSDNTALYAPLSSFSASTTTGGNAWTAHTMQLYVEPGVVYVNGTRVIFSGGSSPTITAPSSHPRIDLLTIDNTGTLALTSGAENASPSAPTYPADKVVLCEIYNVVGETAIYDNENQQSGQGYVYHDVRPILGLQFNPSAIDDSLLPNADGTLDLGSLSHEWNNLYVKSGIFLNGASINALMLASITGGMTGSAGQPVVALPYPAADVTLDAKTAGSGTGTQTISFTVGSNSNRILIVFVAISGNYTLSSQTWNGTTLGAAVDSANNTWANPGNFYSFALVNPATGTHNLVLTPSNGSAGVTYAIFSYYNASQGAIDNHAIAGVGGSPASLALSLLPAANGALVVGAATSAYSPTGTILTNNTQTNNGLESGDSGAIYPASSQTITSNSGTFQAAAAISIAPYTASGATPRAYLASSIQASQCASYMGILQSSMSAGVTATVATGGVDANQSGLTIGSQYYINDTAGSIGTSPGSNTRKAGIAVDTTKLLITNLW